MDSEEVDLQCAGTPVVEAQFGAEMGVTPSEAIITALAEAKNVAPTEIDPIYETIDMGLIDRLLTSQDEGGNSSRVFGFTIEQWNVFLHGSGSIIVCDAEQQHDPTPVFRSAD